MAGKISMLFLIKTVWAVKGAGNQRATSVHDTQQQAIDAAGYRAQPAVRTRHPSSRWSYP